MRSGQLLVLRMGNSPRRRMSHKLTNSMKIWKGIRNTTTLLFSLNRIMEYWRTDDGSERSRKKKITAPRWFEKQEKILGAKGGSWRSKKMETTVYQSNISIFRKSLDLLISSTLNNNNNCDDNKSKHYALPTECRLPTCPLAEMDHSANLGVICGQRVESPCRYWLYKLWLPLKISSFQISHDTGWALVRTARNRTRGDCVRRITLPLR